MEEERTVLQTLPPIVATEPAASSGDRVLDTDEDEETEELDELLWPLLPYYGARAATLEDGRLAYGTITSVDQTAQSRILLYVLTYDEKDLRRHLPAAKRTKLFYELQTMHRH